MAEWTIEILSNSKEKQQAIRNTKRKQKMDLASDMISYKIHMLVWTLALYQITHLLINWV